MGFKKYNKHKRDFIFPKFERTSRAASILSMRKKIIPKKLIFIIYVQHVLEKFIEIIFSRAP